MVEAGCPGGFEQAAKNFMVFDKDGLVGGGRSGLTDEVMVYAHPELSDGTSLEEAIAREQPELILGVSGVSAHAHTHMHMQMHPCTQLELILGVSGVSAHAHGHECIHAHGQRSSSTPC